MESTKRHKKPASKKQNIIVFGCSFSKFKTPTYADILSLTNNLDNRAESGIGNERIFYNVLDAFKKNHFHDKSLIIVQWSFPIRWDYLGTNNEWISSKGRPYEKKIWPKLKEFWNENYEREKTENYMIAVKHILDRIPTEKFYMTFEDCNLNFIDLKNLYGNYQGDYMFHMADGLKADMHPTVFQQYEIARKISRRYRINIHDNITEMLTKVDQEIRHKKEYINYQL